MLFLSVVCALSAVAQIDAHKQCEMKRTEDNHTFEKWINSKANKSAIELTYRIPVVVHVLHSSEPVGEGFNFSDERIVGQIRTLNEDFRKKEGTPGFNSHPDGADTQIEFVLAQIDPEGNPTNGIVRVDRNLVHSLPGASDILVLSSRYSYWDPERYLNIWCWDIGFHTIYAGRSQFPVSDLEGLPQNEDIEADGIFINAVYFGEGENDTIPNFNMGRTLTHEMGHFLGLLHTFGPGGCNYTDYCEDTPPTSSATYRCQVPEPIACDGRPVMIENYMDYSYDRCMNIFTKDQTARMRIVLENSPRRKSLITSPVITGVDDITHALKIYPNPVTDKLYISIGEKVSNLDVNVTACTILGDLLFKKVYNLTGTEIEVSIAEVNEKIIILTIEGKGLSHRQLIMIN